MKPRPDHRRLFTTPGGDVVHQDPLCGHLAHSRRLDAWTTAEVAAMANRTLCKVCKPTLILNATSRR